MTKKENKKRITRKEALIRLNKIIILFHKTSQIKSKKKLDKTADLLAEAIDYLRVCTKYMIFDNESFGREIKALKKLLKNNGIET